MSAKKKTSRKRTSKQSPKKGSKRTSRRRRGPAGHIVTDVEKKRFPLSRGGMRSALSRARRKIAHWRKNRLEAPQALIALSLPGLAPVAIGTLFEEGGHFKWQPHKGAAVARMMGLKR